MKIRQLSDIHLETGPFTYEDQGEDVVVLAGDKPNYLINHERSPNSLTLNLYV